MTETLFDVNAPSALAFSGGGDSTAMMHAFRGQPNLRYAFIIDHALRDGSAEEASAAAEVARSYGYEVHIDRWKHDGITTGLQAKARAYRYSALGRMCRNLGVTQLLTAHTEDDQAETLLMRLDRQTGWRGLAGMAETAYAPIWPALAGVNLCRPWLNRSRQSLRDYNAEKGLIYVDDPSNENRNFARIRARQALAADPALRADLLAQQKQMRARLNQEREEHYQWLVDHARISPHGFIETDAVPPSELLLHILNAVAGRGGPIDAAKRARLCREMMTPSFKAATLSGAWILRQNRDSTSEACHSFVFLRERVAVSGRSGQQLIPSTRLNTHDPLMWDGRFSCKAKVENVRVEAGLGHLQKLRQLPDFKTLFGLPKEVRESLPIFFLGEKPVSFGASDTEFLVSVSSSASRLHALFGKENSVLI